jgi:ABC-type lipoprotein export system ATPase subunit
MRRPDEGEILIDGSNLLKLSDDKLAELRLTKIGFVFQFVTKVNGFEKCRDAIDNRWSA